MNAKQRIPGVLFVSVLALVLGPVPGRATDSTAAAPSVRVVAPSYAIGGENHDATAIFYGRLVDDPEKLAAIHHEIYGTFAALDREPAPEQVDAFVGALRKAGIPNDVHIYDDVNHGFWLHVDQQPEVRTKPAQDAWKRLKAYFSRTIGAAPAP